MITTTRHIIRQLSEMDSHFIFELLNTQGWITYIGHRNIHNEADALGYIQKINENLNAFYWVITLSETHTPIGLVTLIKRDYLDIRDIGFALLPAYSGQGHAYEATKAVLEYLDENIVAITLPENKSSIKLIEKLGLKFEKIIEKEDQNLLFYSSS